MPGVSREQIEQAKRIDLLTYMQTREPENLQKHGQHEYCLKEHDSLKISNGKWNWFSMGIGGKSALDFLIYVRKIDFVEAVEHLTSGQPYTRRETEPPGARHEPAEKERRLVLPEKNKLGTRTLTYLKNERGIDDEIIVKCLSKGILYDGAYKMKNGHKKPVCVFVGKDNDGNARYAFARGTEKGDNFKGDVSGSDKSYGFSIQSELSFSRYSVITESAIDALSVASIIKANAGTAWEKYDYISLGCVSPAAGIRHLRENTGIEKVFLCLDSDKAGREGAKAFRAAVSNDTELKERQIEIVDKFPSRKDYNEVLKAMRTAERTANTRGDITIGKGAEGRERIGER